MRLCPVCQKVELKEVMLDQDLPAHTCIGCGGIWVSANEYLSWGQTHRPALAPDLELDVPEPVFDTNKAILCPDCGRILRRFKIWPHIKFHLDRCKNCNGVWFDKNEWHILKEHNLHQQVNVFFTEPWQKKLRQEEARRRFEKMYLDKFGQADYAEIKRIKQWLTEHPRGVGLLAYLMDDNPYKG